MKMVEEEDMELTSPHEDIKNVERFSLETNWRLAEWVLNIQKAIRNRVGIRKGGEAIRSGPVPWEGTQKRRGITPFLGSEESEPCFRHPISGAQHWKDGSLSRCASRWDWQWGCQKPRPLLRNAHALSLPQRGSGSRLKGPEPLPGFL